MHSSSSSLCYGLLYFFLHSIILYCFWIGHTFYSVYQKQTQFFGTLTSCCNNIGLVSEQGRKHGRPGEKPSSFGNDFMDNSFSAAKKVVPKPLIWILQPCGFYHPCNYCCDISFPLC